MSYRAEVWVETRLVAHVTSWDAQQAVLRLFFGTSLVLPKDVRLSNVTEEHLFVPGGRLFPVPAKTNG